MRTQKRGLAAVAEVRTVVGWRTRLLETEERLGRLRRRSMRYKGVAGRVQEELEELQRREAQCVRHGRVVTP